MKLSGLNKWLILLMLVSVGGCTLEKYPVPGAKCENFGYIVDETKNGTSGTDIIIISKNMALTDPEYAKYKQFFEMENYCPTDFHLCITGISLPSDARNIDKISSEIADIQIEDMVWCSNDIDNQCKTGTHNRELKANESKDDENLYCVPDTPEDCAKVNCLAKPNWTAAKCENGQCKVMGCAPQWAADDTYNDCVPYDACCGKTCGRCYLTGKDVCALSDEEYDKVVSDDQTYKPEDHYELLSCQSHCPGSLVACRDGDKRISENPPVLVPVIECIDPQTNSKFCGAKALEDGSLNCEGYVTCLANQKCYEGLCIDIECEITDNKILLRTDNNTVECVDLSSTNEYCTKLDNTQISAIDPDMPCTLETDGIVCTLKSAGSDGTDAETTTIELNPCDSYCIEGECQQASVESCTKLGQVYCGEVVSDNCIDPNTDKSYCGMTSDCSSHKNCTSTPDCPEGQTCDCVGGNCIVECDNNKTWCTDRCVDLSQDNDLCGTSCETAERCEGGKICVSGTCSYPESWVLCGDTYVNPETSEYCGAKLDKLPLLADGSMESEGQVDVCIYTRCDREHECVYGGCLPKCSENEIRCDKSCIALDSHEACYIYESEHEPLSDSEICDHLNDEKYFNNCSDSGHHCERNTEIEDRERAYGCFEGCPNGYCVKEENSCINVRSDDSFCSSSDIDDQLVCTEVVRLTCSENMHCSNGVCCPAGQIWNGEECGDTSDYCLNSLNEFDNCKDTLSYGYGSVCILGYGCTQTTSKSSGCLEEDVRFFEEIENVPPENYPIKCLDHISPSERGYKICNPPELGAEIPNWGDLFLCYPNQECGNRECISESGD